MLFLEGHGNAVGPLSEEPEGLEEKDKRGRIYIHRQKHEADGSDTI